MNEPLQIRTLITKLNEATKWYDEGNPIITDSQWDDMYFKLQDLEAQTGIIYPDSPTNAIPYEVVNALGKVEHNHPMLSLAKTKDENEVMNFCKTKEVHSIVAMLKMDGLTCSLLYEKGELIRAETRGNGKIGEDITHNAKVVSNIPQNIPITDRPVIVDGEIVCTYTNFEAFSEQYKNPRNFAAGSIRLLDSNECAKRKLSFIAWDFIKGGIHPSISLNLINLKHCGFDIVPYRIIYSDDEFVVSDINKMLQNDAKKYGYPIDGLVYKFNDIEYGNSLGQTAHHKNNAIAFKFADDVYETTLVDIEWGQGREGSLCPVAIFEPVDDGESIITRASLHNLNVMEKLYPGYWYKGLRLKVAKMNQIIPQVLSAEDANIIEDTIEIPAICPMCGASTEIRESDAGIKELWCTNPDCTGKTINILEHFLCKKGLDAKGISKATIQKLLDWGWVNTIEDFFNLEQYKEKWILKAGFGPKSVEKILNSIEKAKDTTLEKFISALGIPLVGTTIAKEIAKREGTWEKFREDIDNKFDFSKWPGFGPEMTIALWNYNYELADKIAAMMRFVVLDESSTISDSLKGQTVVITGTLKAFKNRTELQTKIEACGGKVVGSVSKNTKYLINNDSTSKSAKNIKAQELGIPILTENEFIEKFLI